MVAWRRLGAAPSSSLPFLWLIDIALQVILRVQVPTTGIQEEEQDTSPESLELKTLR